MPWAREVGRRGARVRDGSLPVSLGSRRRAALGAVGVDRRKVTRSRTSCTVRSAKRPRRLGAARPDTRPCSGPDTRPGTGTCVVGPRSRSWPSTSPRCAGLPYTREWTRLRLAALTHVWRRRTTRGRLLDSPTAPGPGPNKWFRAGCELRKLADRRSRRRVGEVTKHLADVQRSGLRPRPTLIDRLPADLTKGRSPGNARTAARTLACSRPGELLLRIPLEIPLKIVVAHMTARRVGRVVAATGRAWDRFGHRVWR